MLTQKQKQRIQELVYKMVVESRDYHCTLATTFRVDQRKDITEATVKATMKKLPMNDNSKFKEAAVRAREDLAEKAKREAEQKTLKEAKIAADAAASAALQEMERQSAEQRQMELAQGGDTIMVEEEEDDQWALDIRAGARAGGRRGQVRRNSGGGRGGRSRAGATAAGGSNQLALMDGPQQLALMDLP
jgi:hypothetical protein